MQETLEPLILDLVHWCAREPRTYREVLDAWRTSCPRLTVWEEAVARGLLETRSGSDGLVVVVTPAGRAHVASQPLSSARPVAPVAAPLPA